MFSKKSKDFATNPKPASSSDPGPGRSSGEQNSQQTETMSRRRHLFPKFNWRSWSPSRSPSPSPSPGMERRNSTGVDDHHIKTSVSKQLIVPASELARPHSSCSGGSILPTHGLAVDDHSVLTARGDITAVSSVDHGSLSSCMPIIQIFHPQSGSNTSGNSAPPTRVTHTPTTAHQGQDPVEIVAARLPQTKSTPGPEAIGPSSHSSAVWTMALEIARQKLSDKNLPPLDITNLNFSAPLVEENIHAVIRGLNTLLEDYKKKRWTYTSHGKEVIIRERLGKILKSVEKYSKLGDTLTQINPQVGAPIWAGVWGIMQVRI